MRPYTPIQDTMIKLVSELNRDSGYEAWEISNFGRDTWRIRFDGHHTTIPLSHDKDRIIWDLSVYSIIRWSGETPVLWKTVHVGEWKKYEPKVKGPIISDIRPHEVGPVGWKKQNTNQLFNRETKLESGRICKWMAHHLSYLLYENPPKRGRIEFIIPTHENWKGELIQGQRVKIGGGFDEWFSECIFQHISPFNRKGSSVSAVKLPNPRWDIIQNKGNGKEWGFEFENDVLPILKRWCTWGLLPIMNFIGHGDESYKTSDFEIFCNILDDAGNFDLKDDHGISLD